MVYLIFHCEFGETRQGQGNFKQKRMMWLCFSYKGLGELSETPPWGAGFFILKEETLEVIKPVLLLLKAALSFVSVW